MSKEDKIIEEKLDNIINGLLDCGTEEYIIKHILSLSELEGKREQTYPYPSLRTVLGVAVHLISGFHPASQRLFWSLSWSILNGSNDRYTSSDLSQLGNSCNT